MPLLVALSTFQSRTQDAAFDGITRHEIDGLQLTPGNLPSPGFAARVAQFDGIVRTHHGFCWERYRRPVYDSNARPISIERDRSVHPPRTAPRHTRDPGPFVESTSWLDVALEHDLLVETMYPGYALGLGRDLEVAMDAGVRLCVDIAHLAIQRGHGVLGDATVRRLLDSASVEEVHVSHSARCKDTHSALKRDTPWLDWARERLLDLPVVLESYWHKLSVDEQARQLDGVRSREVLR